MDEKALVDELKGLRKGQGATPLRVSKCPVLMSLLPNGNPRAALETIMQALGAGIQAQALRNAYGIGLLDPLNLTQRRNDFAVRNDKHTDTVEAYENEMIQELAFVLLMTRRNSFLGQTWANDAEEALAKLWIILGTKHREFIDAMQPAFKRERELKELLQNDPGNAHLWAELVKVLEEYRSLQTHYEGSIHYHHVFQEYADAHGFKLYEEDEEEPEDDA